MIKNTPAASPCSGGEKPIRHPRRIAPTRLATLADVRLEMARLYREARAGAIQTQDATRLAYVLRQIADLIVTAELEIRLRVLEVNVQSKELLP